MADDKVQRDRTREGSAVTPDPKAGTTSEKDFGKTDRYANEDQEDTDFNVRNMGDDTAWDSGRGASITRGTRVENDTRAADAETPGVKTRRPEP